MLLVRKKIGKQRRFPFKGWQKKVQPRQWPEGIAVKPVKQYTLKELETLLKDDGDTWELVGKSICMHTHISLYDTHS